MEAVTKITEVKSVSVGDFIRQIEEAKRLQDQKYPAAVRALREEKEDRRAIDYETVRENEDPKASAFRDVLKRQRAEKMVGVPQTTFMPTFQPLDLSVSTKTEELLPVQEKPLNLSKPKAVVLPVPFKPVPVKPDFLAESWHDLNDRDGSYEKLKYLIPAHTSFVLTFTGGPHQSTLTYEHDNGEDKDLKPVICLETDDLYVYNHQHSPLGRAYQSSFTIDNRQFMSVDHYVEWKKYEFSRHATFGGDEGVWEDRLINVVLEGTKRKIIENEGILSLIKSIPSFKTIVEANPDKTDEWGVGLGIMDPKITCAKHWIKPGNRMGYLLTQMKLVWEENLYNTQFMM